MSLLVLVFYILVGVLTAYILGFVSLLVVRCLELADRRRFAPATELVTRTDNDARVSVYEREEGGVNRYQNHLASLTYVKPGILRAGLLRLTLLAIGLLSRFWFNQGQLAGIPTILAARWALIEGAGGGRRLLFLTNYGGAWDSYLNEFIDMGAVIGLNAIWSNTFIKVDDPSVRMPSRRQTSIFGRERRLRSSSRRMFAAARLKQSSGIVPTRRSPSSILIQTLI